MANDKTSVYELGFDHEFVKANIVEISRHFEALANGEYSKLTIDGVILHTSNGFFDNGTKELNSLDANDKSYGFTSGNFDYEALCIAFNILDKILAQKTGINTMSNTISNLNVTFKKVPNTDSIFQNAVAWAVTINGQNFDYKEGLGHFFTNPKHTNIELLTATDRTGFYRYELNPNHKAKPTNRVKITTSHNDRTVYKITPPAILDVIYCLYRDSQVALCNDFNEFCDEYGYDNDSIKALKTYEACIDTALKLNRLNLDPKELETTFENY